jgi:hypothetical protein
MILLFILFIIIHNIIPIPSQNENLTINASDGFEKRTRYKNICVAYILMNVRPLPPINTDHRSGSVFGPFYISTSSPRITLLYYIIYNIISRKYLFHNVTVASSVRRNINIQNNNNICSVTMTRRRRGRIRKKNNPVIRRLTRGSSKQTEYGKRATS